MEPVIQGHPPGGLWPNCPDLATLLLGLRKDTRAQSQRGGLTANTPPGHSPLSWAELWGRPGLLARRPPGQRGPERLVHRCCKSLGGGGNLYPGQKGGQEPKEGAQKYLGIFRFLLSRRLAAWAGSHGQVAAPAASPSQQAPECPRDTPWHRVASGGKLGQSLGRVALPAE